MATNIQYTVEENFLLAPPLGEKSPGLSLSLSSLQLSNNLPCIPAFSMIKTGEMTTMECFSKPMEKALLILEEAL